MAMALTKTQVYLTRRQHHGLTREAHRLGVSLAELFRRIADDHLDRAVVAPPTPKAIRGIVKLGRSGLRTISRDHHRALDEGAQRAPVR